MSKLIFLMIFAATNFAYGSSKQLKDNLHKVNISLQITKNKIRSTQEVTFIPDLQFTLAELMLEKARLMFAIKKSEDTKVPLAELDFSGEKRALADGVDQLRLVEERYPNYKQLDKVLFTLGVELYGLGETATALQTYKRVIDKFPQSKFALLSSMEVGNIYFGKHDYEFALEQYQRVISAPRNAATSRAHYKAGWCEVFREHFLAAMLHFEDVYKNRDLDAGLASPNVATKEKDQTKKADLVEDALVASVWPLSELSEKELRDNPRFLKPITYYEGVAEDKILLRRSLRRLSQRLEFKNRFLEAAEATSVAFLIDSDLQETNDTMETLSRQRFKAKINDVSDGLLHKITDNLWLLKERGIEKDLAKYEPLLRDVLTRAHASALQVKRIEDLRSIADGYRQYAQLYPDSKSHQNMLVNEAETRYLAKDYARAAQLYYNVARNINKTDQKKSKEFFDASAQAYTAAFQGSDELSLLDRTLVRSSYRNLAKVYASQFPKDSNLPALRFNAAKSLYDEQSYGAATIAFREFLHYHPLSAKSEQAAVLLLDCFYLRDSLKGLVTEGKTLMAGNALDAGAKAKVASVIQQSQLKRVQSIAGEFATKKYADKFLEIAKRNKNSTLGEPALSEAFASLKASNDERLYETGEQYVAQFSDKPRAKEILNLMITTALVTVDLGRAADYMRAYAQKYPTDNASAGYLTQSLTLLEQTGQAQETVDILLQNKQTVQAAKWAADYGLWSRLAPIAATMPGSRGLYYQGLALLRQNHRDESLALMRRSLDAPAADAESKEMQAHAGIILAEAQISDLLGTEKETFSVPVLQKMLVMSKSTNAVLQEVLTKESGKWSIAALADTARLNREFARILTNAHPPTGFTPEAFHKMIDPQIKGYANTAKEYNSKCVETADKENVLSEYNRMCRTNGQQVVAENEQARTRPEGKKPAVFMSAATRTALMKTPRSMALLKTAAHENATQGNFYGTYAFASRMTEVDASAAGPWVALGEAARMVGLPEQSAVAYRTALQKDPGSSNAKGALDRLAGKGGRSPASTGGDL